jgi:hypothetical protein
VLRITLDAAGRPAVFECTQPCGCFHGVFVSTDLEAAARAQFGAVAPQRVHAVEPPLGEDGDDWIVRDLVEVRPGARTVLYMSAGKHFCAAIRHEPDAAVRATVPARRGYDLRAYDALEHVPRDGGGEGTIFNERGLVLGGKRWMEEVALGDLDSPGWPRHLDRMLIHWDASRWNDPALLATHLRLPRSMTDPAASPARPRGSGAVAGHAGAAARGAGDDRAGHRLVLFTNRACAGCEQTKRTIAGSPAVQRAMRGWEYEVVDTATADGARLAAAFHVSLVPVLIGVDGGRELFRSEEVDTAEQILAAIRGAAPGGGAPAGLTRRP